MIVKELMTGDVSPVAMFLQLLLHTFSLQPTQTSHFQPPQTCSLSAPSNLFSEQCSLSVPSNIPLSLKIHTASPSLYFNFDSACFEWKRSKVIFCQKITSSRIVLSWRKQCVAHFGCRRALTIWNNWHKPAQPTPLGSQDSGPEIAGNWDKNPAGFLINIWVDVYQCWEISGQDQRKWNRK